jgi:putative NADPH-quinone reductase
LNVLVVLAHPLADSFAASIARTTREMLEASGHSVDLLDLYAEDFDPRLTVAERKGYFDDPYDHSAVSGYVERLRDAEALILVFPQWWFNLPAIIKGYIDRVFVPGVAFQHDLAGGRLVPKLTNIRHFWVLTTTGSPWWIARVYMGNPVRRQLKRGVAAFCARKLDFRMMALHDMDRATPEKRMAFLERVRTALKRL